MPNPQEVRTFALVGSQGAGKTALAEAMLQVAGALEGPSRPHDPGRILDSDPEEIEHKTTLSIGAASCVWKGCRLFLLDTPGSDAFQHETRRALRVADAALFVLEASDHFKPQFDALWKMMDEFALPRVVFLSKMDQERAAFPGVLAHLREARGLKPVLLQWPIGKEAALSGVVDLLSMHAWVSKGGGSLKGAEGEVPSEVRTEAEEARQGAVEGVAESDDKEIERYLEGATLTPEELDRTLHQGVVRGRLLPVAVGSSPRGVGVAPLLDLLVRVFPLPVERGPIRGHAPGPADPPPPEVQRDPAPSAPFSALIFKTTIDPFSGKLSYLRVYSGTLAPDATVLNVTRGTRERLTHLELAVGKHRTPLPSASPGMVVAVPKLKDALTGDSLADEKAPVRYDLPPEPEPVLSLAVVPKSQGDDDRLSTALHRIAEEDPALKFSRDEQTKDLVLSGTGQGHLELLLARLKRKYGVDADMHPPKVPYRETVRARARAEGKYVRQSGGRGQYGVCVLEMEPLPRGGGFEFVDQIFGGAIPRNFIPAVEKGIREALSHGVVAGFPVADVRVMLVDGKHHVVDSSDMAFKIAGSMAFKKAMEQAQPVLLEPLLRLDIRVPEDVLGDLIGDLNARRGKIMGLEPEGHVQLVHVLVPQSEALLYASDLRSISQGRGSFRMHFDRYDEVPSHLSEKIVHQARLEQGKSEEAAEEA